MNFLKLLWNKLEKILQTFSMFFFEFFFLIQLCSDFSLGFLERLAVFIIIVLAKKTEALSLLAIFLIYFSSVSEFA